MLIEEQMEGIFNGDDIALLQDIMPRWWNLLTTETSWKAIYHGTQDQDVELDIAVNTKCMVGEVMLFTDEYAYPQIHEHSPEQQKSDKILEQYGLLFFNMITAMTDMELVMGYVDNENSEAYCQSQEAIDNVSLSFIRTLKLFCDHLRAYHSDDIDNAKAYHEATRKALFQAIETNPNTEVN